MREASIFECKVNIFQTQDRVFCVKRPFIFWVEVDFFSKLLSNERTNQPDYSVCEELTSSLFGSPSTERCLTSKTQI